MNVILFSESIFRQSLKYIRENGELSFFSSQMYFWFNSFGVEVCVCVRKATSEWTRVGSKQRVHRVQSFKMKRINKANGGIN